MAICPVNADQPLPPGLIHRAARLPRGAPLVVMIHGFRYSPHDPASDPHRHILALKPDRPGARRMCSWPSSLGFTRDGAEEGLGITFGWHARGGLREAYRRAGAVGQGLGALVGQLSAAAGRPVQMIAHSLGARVALQALASAPPGSVGRVVLMAGAELRPAAEAAMDSPAAQQAEIINVTSRENDLFDLATQVLLGRARRPALGFGLSEPRRNWLDLQIDAPATRAGLAALGFDIAGDVVRACHWSPYTREGLFDFYRVALAQPWALPLPLLRAHLPISQNRRWSRLFQPPRLAQSSFLSRA
ncbi:hypothetical protein ACFSC1_00130 [Paracoccus aurantiacus]